MVKKLKPRISPFLSNHNVKNQTSKSTVRVAMQDDYTVRLVDSLEDLEEINRIRCEVFVDEQGYPKGVENDECVS